MLRRMSTLRKNSITGNIVIFASGRRGRPRQTVDTRSAVKCADHPSHVASCPFCRGNEEKTPPTLYEIRRSPEEMAQAQAEESLEEGGAEMMPPHAPWSLRVVRNAFPAVAVPSGHGLGESITKQQTSGRANVEMEAVGFHEVVIESPKHNACSALQPKKKITDILSAWRSRGRALRDSDPLLQHVLYFKNNGTVAGASLVHPHSQIVGLPIVARDAAVRQQANFKWFTAHKKSVFEQVIDEEMSLRDASLSAGSGGMHRVVEQNDHFISFVPFAAISPFHLYIVPTKNTAHFEEADDKMVEACGEILSRSLRRHHYTLDEPDWNMVLRSAPLRGRHNQKALDADHFYRWHIVLTPRLSAGAMAGFELGSGMFSNGNAPEEDAALLRDVDESLLV